MLFNSELELRESIRHMTRQTMLYKILRDELTKLGYWHKLSRGNPQKGYEKSKFGKKVTE